MWSFKKREVMTFRTTDGNRLAPFPGMTDEELRDFEKDAEEMTGIKIRKENLK